jgi:formylglycine-generating enzyme
MADIFISYAKEDREQAAAVTKALGSLGWQVFWDRDIPLGKTWDEVIEKAIEAAGCMLVLWSRNSVASEWVRAEAEEGLQRKILIPVLIEEAKIPLRFRPLQAASLVDWREDPSYLGFKQLVQAIAQMIGAPPPREKQEATKSEVDVIAEPPKTVLPKPKPTEAAKVEVTIAKPDYLQTTEVSQGQWKKVMGDKDSPWRRKACGDDCPVESVSWEDAQRFIEKLNQLEKTKGYHLPSEAEWEYACRAGTTTEYSFGADSKMLGEFAWYSEYSEMKTHPVGKKRPNAWGLYDMAGNVWEWVEDDWHGNYKGAPGDGSAWIDNPRGAVRVARGGSWDNTAAGCRSAGRILCWPGDRHDGLGFRLSRSVSLDT